jgi:hypothetical protein
MSMTCVIYKLQKPIVCVCMYVMYDTYVRRFAMHVCMHTCIARDHSCPGASFIASSAICSAGLQASLLYFTHVVAQKNSSPSFKDYLRGGCNTRMLRVGRTRLLFSEYNFWLRMIYFV